MVRVNGFQARAYWMMGPPVLAASLAQPLRSLHPEYVQTFDAPHRTRRVEICRTQA